MANGIYAADGSWNVTVVSGSTFTGLFAADGSFNIKVRTSEYGAYHSCGAILVTVRTVPGTSIYAPDGSMYVSTAPYVYGSQRVTVVTGTLSTGQYTLSVSPIALTLSFETMTPTLGYAVSVDPVALTLAMQPVTLSTTAAGYSTEAQAVFAAMTTPPDTTRKGLIDACIVGLKSDGVWSLLDALQVYAAADTQAATVDWVLPSRLATLTNAPTFTTDRGYLTNGTSNFVDTQFNPSTGTNFLQNSMMFGVWSRTSASIATSGSGWFDGTRGTTINPRATSAISYRATSSTATSTTTPAIADGAGFFTINRDSSTTTQSYRNGSAVTPAGTGTSGAIASATLKMGAISASSFHAREWAAMAAGGNLTSTQHLALYNRLQTYMTAVGA